MKFCTVIALVASAYAEADIPAEARSLGHRHHSRYAPLPVVYGEPIASKAQVLPVLSKGVPLAPRTKAVFPPTPLTKKDVIVPRVAIEKAPIAVPLKKGPIVPLATKHTPIVTIPTKQTPIAIKPSKVIRTIPTKKAALPVVTKRVAPIVTKETIVNPIFQKGGLRHLGAHHNNYYPVGYVNGGHHHHHHEQIVPVVAAPQAVPVVQVAQPIIVKEGKTGYVY